MIRKEIVKKVWKEKEAKKVKILKRRRKEAKKKRK